MHSLSKNGNLCVKYEDARTLWIFVYQVQVSTLSAHVFHGQRIVISQVFTFAETHVIT